MIKLEIAHIARPIWKQSIGNVIKIWNRTSGPDMDQRDHLSCATL